MRVRLKLTFKVSMFIIRINPNVANSGVSYVRAAFDYSPADDNYRTPDVPHNAYSTREFCL